MSEGRPERDELEIPPWRRAGGIVSMFVAEKHHRGWMLTIGGGVWRCCFSTWREMMNYLEAQERASDGSEESERTSPLNSNLTAE